MAGKGRRGTNAGQSRRNDLERRGMVSKLGSRSNHCPILRAAVFGHIARVYHTLTQMDRIDPEHSGVFLPDLPIGWVAPDVTPAREAWLAAGA